MEYIKYKVGTEVVNTNVPLKKDGIYYLNGDENYYLVSSGNKKDLQNPFVEKGIIGIGWDKISLNDINILDENSLKDTIEEKYSFYEKNYSSEQSFKQYCSLTANKLLRFVKEIQLGDIVVLKDRGSNCVYFGKIISDALDYSEDDLYVDDVVGVCNKIRKVRWLKKIKKDNLATEIKLAFTSRHALSFIKQDKVKEAINREIFSYFYCGENLHIVFNIGFTNNISQDSFKEFLDLIYNLKQKCIKENNSENNFNIKTNVQSPGPVEYFGNPEIAKYIYGVVTGVGIVGMYHCYNRIKEKLKIKTPQKNDEEIEDRFSAGN